MKKLLPLFVLAGLILTINLKSVAHSSKFRLVYPVVDTNTWVYNSTVDKMTSETSYLTYITANDKLHFDFPYNGGSTAIFSIFNYKKGILAGLRIDKGQFVCNDCTITVRFDSNPSIEVKANPTGDGSTTLLALSPDKKFLGQLKKAKKMLIQAEFYQSGVQVMEFNVAGLIWNH